MDAVVDRLASPPIFTSLCLVAFFLSMRSRALWRREGGLALAALGLALAGVVAGNADLRARLLAPERLPAVVWLALSAGVLWLAMHRAEVADDRAPSPGTEPRPNERSSRPRSAAMIGVGLLLMACTLVLETPLGGPATGTVAAGPAKAPWFLVGFQELRLYFEPWAALLAPGLVLLALLALPYLDLEPASGKDARRQERTVFLFGWLIVVVLPIVIGNFLRGPHWRAVGLLEPWDPAYPPPRPPVALSEAFWCDWLPFPLSAPPPAWPLRELPGFVLLTVYFVFLPRWLARWQATRGIFERTRKSLGPRRYRLAVALGLALLLVPLKMYGRWLLDVGHWLYLPELGFGF